MIIDILKHALELAREGVEIHNENSPEYKVCAALIATLEAKDEPDYKALWKQMCERCDELDKKLAQQEHEPVAWKWHQAPVNKTSWGDEIVVADLAIDKDHTVSIYCERDQTAKVEAMFTQPHQEAKDEPVAWMDSADDVFYTEEDAYKVGFQPIRPLYTTPPSAPVQEPVANASAWFALVMNAAAELEDASHCLRDEDAKRVAISGAKHYRDAAKALYTTPPRRKPLTDEEIQQIFIANSVVVDNGNAYMVAGLRALNIARAIEAKLKEKNT